MNLLESTFSALFSAIPMLQGSYLVMPGKKNSFFSRYSSKTGFWWWLFLVDFSFLMSVFTYKVQRQQPKLLIALGLFWCTEDKFVPFFGLFSPHIGRIGNVSTPSPISDIVIILN